MKAICNLLVAMVLFFAVPSNASADTQHQYKDTYATIQPGTNLNMRQGPGKNNLVVEKILGGSTVKIVNLDTYDQGWVCVESKAGNTGYVARRYLMGNYVEEFNSRELVPIIPEKPDEEDTDSVSVDQSSFFAPFINFLRRTFDNLISLGWWAAFLIVAAALALVGGIIYYIRSYDGYFEEPWIHYLLYFLTILPTWGMFEVVLMYIYNPDFSENILLFLFAMIPAILSVHAGWGVRQCGMYYGKYHKNANRKVGQLLQFPVWMMITLMFWYTVLLPLIELSEYFDYSDGGFWHFVLGLIIVGAIISAVMLAWTLFFVRKFFRTAGNWPVYIMTIALWWALTRIAFNWAYANFNGFAYLLMLFFGAIVLIGIIGVTLLELRISRCPMCHNCDAEQTNLTDEGVSCSTSTAWESMGSRNIRPRHRGAEVSNARRLVRTTVATHNWTTEHTCPVCGYNWDISHSEEVGRDKQVLKDSWDETY